MRVVLHCVYYPPERGGLESHVHHLARGLVRRGCQVATVTSRSTPGAPRHEILDGVEVWRTWFPGRNPVGWTLHSLASLPRSLRVARKADLFHAQAFPSVVPGVVVRSWLRRVGKGRRRLPLVATFHTSHFLARARTHRWRPILSRLVRAPDYCLAPSREIAEVAEGLRSGRRVEALPNGVDTELFRRVEPSLPSRRGTRIMVPRRLVPKNGVEYLIRALPRLRERLPEVEVVLVGDGPERGALEELARHLKVDDLTRFMGGRPHEEMPGLLSSADLVVVPSLMEATSVAALEAMACAVPVAASRVGGLPEIVNGETGTLFSPGDPEDLADRVGDLALQPDLRELGHRARERVVERWSNDRLVERHLTIYRALVEGRQPPSPGGDVPGYGEPEQGE